MATHILPLQHEAYLNFEERKDGHCIKQIHRITTADDREIAEFRLRLSYHSQKRSQQRGVHSDAIAMAMTYGELFQKQGMCYFVVREQDLPTYLSPAEKKRLRNLVVLTNGKTNTLITTYKNRKARKHIRKKSEWLGRIAA